MEDDDEQFMQGIVTIENEKEVVTRVWESCQYIGCEY